MIVVLYVVSILLFCLAVWVVSLPFEPLVWAYKSLFKVPVILPTNPVYLLPYICGTIVLLHLTRYIWASLGYNMGWLFPVMILALHFLWGNRRTANKPNQAQAFSVVTGVVCYGISRLF